MVLFLFSFLFVYIIKFQITYRSIERKIFTLRLTFSLLSLKHRLLFSGDILNETSNQIHIQLKTPGSLRMFHLKPKDSGLYKCMAENRHGIAVSSMELLVNDIDLHLFAINIASTYVTLVWNGTARNLFPEYQILYHRIDGNNLLNTTKYETVTVNHFLRSYTINNLLPNHRYKMCIAIRDDDTDIVTNVQLSCTVVQTAPAYMVGSMSGTVLYNKFIDVFLRQQTPVLN